MDRRSQLQITGAVAAALLATACGRQPDYAYADRDTAICTNRQGQRVPDANCERRGTHGGGGGNAFLWYYLGRGSAMPYYGERAAGGAWTRTAGASYYHAPPSTAMTRASFVSRGGFGTSARAFGGFGS